MGQLNLKHQLILQRDRADNEVSRETRWDDGSQRSKQDNWQEDFKSSFLIDNV